MVGRALGLRMKMREGILIGSELYKCKPTNDINRGAGGAHIKPPFLEYRRQVATQTSPIDMRGIFHSKVWNRFSLTRTIISGSGITRPSKHKG